MKTYEVMKKMIGPYFQEMARRLRLSGRTIYRWTEPTDDYSDSGAYSPLDRLEELIDEAKRLGQPPECSFAPVIYLVHRFGGVYIPPLSSQDSIKELTAHVCHVIEDFGTLISTVSRAVEPDSDMGSAISPNERREISMQAIDVIQAVSALLKAVEKEAANATRSDR